MKKELDLYRTIYETRHIEKTTAEKIVVQVKEEHDSLDKKKLFLEQSALISKINRTLSNKVYSNFVPNYKTIASVYSIFQEALPVKDRVLLEENIVDQMSSSVEVVQETQQQPIDSLVYTTFASKFNEEYAEVLNENQKKLLGNYITSLDDSQLELKVYLNEEIGRIKERLEALAESKVGFDSSIKEKIQKVYNVLDETKNREIDTETLEIVLTTQQILEEIEKDGD